RLPVRAVAAAVFASTGLARLLPFGPAAAAAWQARQYRRRDPASGTAGVWAVLAGGVASTVAALALLAPRAAAPDRGWLLPGGAAPLAAVTAAAMAARRAASSGGPRLGLALLVLATAQLMVVLDATIVNVALPHIQRALGFSGSGLEWVVNAYALTF